MDRRTANLIFSTALEFISCALNELVETLLVSFEEGRGRGIHEGKGGCGLPCLDPEVMAGYSSVKSTSPVCPTRTSILFSLPNMLSYTETRASLYLDPSIRDWVLFPISLVMVRYTC